MVTVVLVRHPRPPITHAAVDRWSTLCYDTPKPPSASLFFLLVNFFWYTCLTRFLFCVSAKAMLCISCATSFLCSGLRIHSLFLVQVGEGFRVTFVILLVLWRGWIFLICVKVLSDAGVIGTEDRDQNRDRDVGLVEGKIRTHALLG